MSIGILAERVLSLLRKKEPEIRAALASVPLDSLRVDLPSVSKTGRSVLLTGREEQRPFLLAVADYDRVMPDGFAGEAMKLSDGGFALDCPLNPANAAALYRHLPWTAPGRFPGSGRDCFGCGDGEAFYPEKCGTRFPVFLLQGGDPAEKCASRTFDVFRSGCRDGWGLEWAV